MSYPNSSPSSSLEALPTPVARADKPNDLRGMTCAEHISAALEEKGDDWEAGGAGRSAQEIIARQLVALAMSGDKKAIEIILDRVEGKPRQAPDRVHRDPDEVVEIG